MINIENHNNIGIILFCYQFTLLDVAPLSQFKFCGSGSLYASSMESTFNASGHGPLNAITHVTHTHSMYTHTLTLPSTFFLLYFSPTPTLCYVFLYFSFLENLINLSSIYCQSRLFFFVYFSLPVVYDFCWLDIFQIKSCFCLFMIQVRLFASILDKKYFIAIRFS